MTIKVRKFKTAIVKFGGLSTDYSCQLMSTKPTNNTSPGDKYNTFCADGSGEHQEETEPDWSVDLKFKSDWTPTGLNRYLQANDGLEKELTIQFDNAVTDWDRTWTGTVVIQAPGDGGDAGASQETEVTFAYNGKPELTYADEEE